MKMYTVPSNINILHVTYIYLGPPDLHTYIVREIKQ